MTRKQGPTRRSVEKRITKSSGSGKSGRKQGPARGRGNKKGK